MHITLVHVHVKPGCQEAFVAATRANRAASRNEPGNIRFDCIQQEDDEQRFVLVEVYEDAETAAAHKETQHYRTWREAVESMMVESRQGIRYRAVTPLQEG
ncbi:MAG: antibiotic biosynthesis monooxygenase [Planctomycetota bacterium]